MSDLAPVLLALDAEAHVLGADGTRTFSVEELLPGVVSVAGELKVNALRRDQVIVELRVPPPPSGLRQGFQKCRFRQSWDFAVASVAAVVQFDGEVCREARVVLGAVAAGPWRARQAEDYLRGRPLDAAACEAAAERALAGARPLASNRYKVPLVRELVRQTLDGLRAG